jgi:pyruvate kinase
MLSGESAAGDYPIEAVLTMDTIAKAIEETINFQSRLNKMSAFASQTVSDAIGVAVAQTALTLPKAEVIMAFTETGGTARRLCKFKPSVPVVAITNREDTARKLTYYFGVHAAIRDNVTDINAYDKVATDVAKDYGFEAGTTIIITSGWAQQHGTTNTLRIIDVK